MNPNEVDLFAGIAGAEPAVEHFDFGHDVTLSKTYAHVFAPFLIAFDRPPAPGAAHPAPWKAVSGGLGFDIEAELYLPARFSMTEWFDRMNTVWWLLALMRLRATPLVSVPVIANRSFSTAASERTEFWPVEIRTHRLMPEAKPKTTLDEQDLAWVGDHWIQGGKLMHHSTDFNVAFQAFDQCIWTADPSLAMVSLWGALERIFSPSHRELRFRVPATIAAYLEIPGSERHRVFKQAKRLYDARSEAAHGSKPKEAQALVETYSLVKKVLVMMIEAGHVPTREHLEARVFGVDGQELG